MRITRATPDDLDTLVAFRDQAAAWLASKGIDQWQEPWPTPDLMVEGMLANTTPDAGTDEAAKETAAQNLSGYGARLALYYTDSDRN